MKLQFLAFALVLTATNVFSAEHNDSAAQAVAADTPGYVLSVDANGPGIKHIEHGDYAAAIEAANYAVLVDRALSAHMTLCVAYIRTHAITEARIACDDAVELAHSPITTALNPHGRRNRDGLAKAHSNRGVLRAIEGDLKGASADFAIAMRQNRQANIVRHNRALIETGVQLAENR